LRLDHLLMRIARGNAAMLGFDEPKVNSNRDFASDHKYMVCAGGYPLATMNTFAAAVARARQLRRLGSDYDYSIYEVDTRIHFDVSTTPSLDDDASPMVTWFPTDFGLHIG
jgi:hypothetical protein